MHSDRNGLSWIGNGVTLISGIMAQDWLQIVLLCLGILGSCFSLAFTIWNWYKAASKDGRITIEELSQLRHDASGDAEALKNGIDELLNKDNRSVK